jgi:Glutaredoxin-like domain (DUF836)
MVIAGDSDGHPVRVVLLSRSGCHLCDDARTVIARVCADVGTGWREDDIGADPVLQRRHTDDVPVTFVDGVVHDFWRVDEARLRAALAATAGP